MSFFTVPKRLHLTDEADDVDLKGVDLNKKKPKLFKV